MGEAGRRRRSSSGAIAFALLLAMPLLSACSGAKEPPPPLQLRAPHAVVWNDFLGVNAQFHWFPPQVYRVQMQRLRDLGLAWVRLGLNWDRLEPQPGKFEWQALDPVMESLKESGLHSAVYLVGSAPFASSAPPGDAHRGQYPPKDPLAYAAALTALAARYPQVDVWQVWNEPNLPAFWYPREDPEAYARLFLASREAMRQVLPDRKVGLAGMAYYSQMPRRGGLMLEALAKSGVLEPDTVISYHPYLTHPEGDTEDSGDFVQRANFINSGLRGLGLKQIWADEWGWSSYAGPKEAQAIIGSSGQADYVLRQLVQMSTQDYDRIFLFTLSDLDQRASPRDRGYGLLDLEGNPKPVYRALARFLAITGPRLEPADPPAVQAAPRGLIGASWRRQDGHRLWMFWAHAEGRAALPGIASAVLHDPLSGRSATLAAHDGRLEVPVSTSLSILEWP